LTYSVIPQSLENLSCYYAPTQNNLRWPSVFVLPGWLAAWWQSFGAGYTAQPLLVCRDGEVIGIAPLKIKDGEVSFIGDNSVCDYLDFITVPGTEDVFAAALLDFLSARGVEILRLETLRPDSVAAVNITREARQRGWENGLSLVETSFEIELPSVLEEYTASLESRHRRDIERKVRRLESVAPLCFEVLRDSEIGDAELEIFFHMMESSRRDKASFLTEEMRAYFRCMTSEMSGYGLLRLAFLYVGVAQAASILYFDYNNRIYLYNSGYAAQYAGMNAGLISKLYAIRRAVVDGKKVFDFIKGPESYKARFGGRKIELYRCDIVISRA